MFRAPPTLNLLAQEGRLWMLSLLVTQLSLRPGFLDLLSGCSGCKGFCTTGDTTDECCLCSDFATECQPRPLAWFLLKFPRNSSHHWLVFRPIRLLGLCWHPMIHVDMALVLVLSPLIPSWSLYMLSSLVDDWSCDSFGKRVFLWSACCNRDSFSNSVVLWNRGLTIRGYVLLCDSFGNGWDTWIWSAHWWGVGLPGAVDWIAVNTRTRRMKAVAHLGHAWRADQCTLCERSWT